MRKKGFTLIELIIVIAIIGILSAILIPSWGYYMQRARTRSQNLKCKTIFNAAQSVVTDMKFYDKAQMNIGLEEKGVVYGYKSDGNSEYVYYWNGSQGALLNSNGTMNLHGEIGVNNASVEAGNKKIASEINKILNDSEVVYKIYVKNYKVMSVVSARSENDRYLGSYPLTLDKLEEIKPEINVNTIREGKIGKVDMTLFDLDESNDGTGAPKEEEDK